MIILPFFTSFGKYIFISLATKYKNKYFLISHFLYIYRCKSSDCKIGSCFQLKKSLQCFSTRRQDSPVYQKVLDLLKQHQNNCDCEGDSCHSLKYMPSDNPTSSISTSCTTLLTNPPTPSLVTNIPSSPSVLSSTTPVSIISPSLVTSTPSSPSVHSSTTPVSIISPSLVRSTPSSSVTQSLPPSTLFILDFNLILEPAHTIISPSCISTFSEKKLKQPSKLPPARLYHSYVFDNELISDVKLPKMPSLMNFSKPIRTKRMLFSTNLSNKRIKI